MIRRLRSNPGFSLVEMMAAMSIFGIAAFALIESTTVCLRSAATFVGYTQAVFLAEQEMEETLAGGWLIPGTSTGGFGARYPAHSWRRNIERTDRKGLYQVRVTVTWSEHDRQREYVLTTLAAERQ